MIKSFVNTKKAELSSSLNRVALEGITFNNLIRKLKHGVAPSSDSDGITAEHFLPGLSPTLATILADVYSIMLSSATVPKSFCTGILIPILKKPSCDPNNLSNYR